MEHYEYLTSVLRTARKDIDNGQQQLNALLGICGEAGEIADSIKKSLFQGHTLLKKDIENEIGDVLYYLYLLADTLGTNIPNCMEANREKLQKRYPVKFSSEQSINRRE